MQLDISRFLRGLAVALFSGAAIGAVGSLIGRGRIDLDIVLMGSLGFGLIPPIVVLLDILFRRIATGGSAKPQASGRITPSKIIGTIAMIVFSLMVAGGIGLTFRDDPVAATMGFILTAACLTCIGFSVPMLTHVHDVNWDEGGIEGPSRSFGLTLGLARTQIRWADVVSTGETKTQYWFVQSADGRRIYWGFYYSGSDAFEKQLLKRCINLHGTE